MRLLLAALALFALAHAAPASYQPAAHPYVVPSCHGLAEVPGYSRCHP